MESSSFSIVMVLNPLRKDTSFQVRKNEIAKGMKAICKKNGKNEENP